MGADRRQREILDRARQAGRVDVVALSEELRVAPETIRRDLRHLADRGVVHRVHGGALPVESAGFETDVAHRTSTSVVVKRRIAAAAASMLHGAETVYVDEGITPMFVAEALQPAVGGAHHLDTVGEVMRLGPRLRTGSRGSWLAALPPASARPARRS